MSYRKKGGRVVHQGNLTRNLFWDCDCLIFISSYYNEKEMLMVLKYVQALTSLSFDNDRYRVKPEQIGIVTPYIRQVRIDSQLTLLLN